MRTKARATGEEKILWRSWFSSLVVLLRVIFALCLEAEGRFPLPIYALAVTVVPRFSGARIARTLLRHAHARPIARPNKRQRGGGFRDDMLERRLNMASVMKRRRIPAKGLCEISHARRRFKIRQEISTNNFLNKVAFFCSATRRRCGDNLTQDVKIRSRSRRFTLTLRIAKNRSGNLLDHTLPTPTLVAALAAHRVDTSRLAHPG